MLSQVVSVVLPAFWPFYQGLYLLFAPENALKKPMQLKEYKFTWTPWFLLTFNLGALVYILLSVLSFTYTFPDLTQPIDWLYWVPVIIARDLFVTVLIYEPWHWAMYRNRASMAKLSVKKFNPSMPDEQQVRFYFVKPYTTECNFAKEM